MTMRAVWTIAFVPLAVAACDQRQPTTPHTPIVVHSEAQDKLHKLNEMDRAIGLKRAIYAAGEVCKRVEKSGYVTEYKNMSMWTASCDDGKQWAIFVGADASAQVRPCQDLAQLKLPACVVAPASKLKT
jgi:hypothetical protein